MEFKNYYKTLGVARDATADEIKKAFRRLARKYHPDVSKEEDAEQKMQAVNEAYAVLSDTEKRVAYDQLGQDRSYQAGSDFQPPPGWDAGFEFSGRGPNGAQSTNFSDFFSELFGKQMGAGSGQPHRMRGQDHHAKIMLDLEDSYQGARRNLTLRMPKLNEQGHTILAEHTLNVRIPKGIYSGQVIRLAGQGGPGTAGEAAGDLFLEVHFNAHSRYRADKKDVYTTLPIAPWEAALGTTIKVPLPDGLVEVRIPENAKSGSKLRLKGRGIPAKSPGDIYLVLEIAIPPAATQKQREFYQAMAKEFTFNPRKNSGA